MKFGYIGIDYKHADQDIRDRVSFTDNQKIDFLQKAVYVFQYLLIIFCMVSICISLLNHFYTHIHTNIFYPLLYVLCGHFPGIVGIHHIFHILYDLSSITSA